MTSSEQHGSGREARIRIFNTGRVLKSDPAAGPVKTPILWHPCNVPSCTNHAPFGFGVSLLNGRLGKWYCTEHKPE